ncbi:hypothetical protein CR513_17276, partial [Mucuna pruriens]
MEREHHERRPETNPRRRETIPKCEEPQKCNREIEGASRLRGIINTIAGGFVGGSSSSIRKSLLKGPQGKEEATSHHLMGSNPEKNDPMVITVEVANFTVNKLGRHPIHVNLQAVANSLDQDIDIKYPGHHSLHATLVHEVPLLQPIDRDCAGRLMDGLAMLRRQPKSRHH